MDQQIDDQEHDAARHKDVGDVKRRPIFIADVPRYKIDDIAIAKTIDDIASGTTQYAT